MSDDILWQIFTDTGDPISWLIYRAGGNDNNNASGAEEEPYAPG